MEILERVTQFAILNIAIVQSPAWFAGPSFFLSRPSIRAATPPATATAARMATAGVARLRVYTSKACCLCAPVKFVARKAAGRLGLPYEEERSSASLHLFAFASCKNRTRSPHDCCAMLAFAASSAAPLLPVAKKRVANASASVLMRP